MRLKFLSFSNLTLLVALSLSSVAAYYSIIGLTAIFAGAVIPVIIMGSILEVGKITTTVWLRKYWSRASWLIKLYLVPAVIALAMLTSMGIFGFLSKAHMDQGVVSGDAVAKVSIFDEKIKTAKDNIDANRKVLKQMDEAVDQIMGRSTSETGADKAVAVRRSQQKERTRIIAEIQAEQATISKLSEERAPLAAEVRKVEAEVGPIKYIAALIYGDNADSNMLEAAVRWVIILLVAVFDPLAIALVLAANASKEWDDEQPAYEPDDGPINEEALEKLRELAKEELPTGELVTKSELFPDIDEGNKLIDEIEREVPEVILPKQPFKFVDYGEHPKDYDETQVEEPVVEVKEEKSIFEQHPYLLAGFDHFKNTTPMVYKPEPKVNAPIETENVTKEDPIQEVEGGYVTYNGALMHKDALQGLHPELFRLTADSVRNINTNFGIKFPDYASKGDIFIRVDALPNRVYKFDGYKWIQVNKDQSDSYLHDKEYIKYLVTSIENGQYDVELLSENEKLEIEEYLKTQKG
jgi:hypothetical protein